MVNERRDALLEVTGLQVRFDIRGGSVHAVNDISFDVRPGELLGVVGESGSGKSVAMMSLLGLLPTPPARIAGGTARFVDQDLLRLPASALRAIRGHQIGFVFQDPMTSLNPVFTVGHQIAEPLRRHLGHSRKRAWQRAAELLALVGIPDPERRLKDYPHEFSGGMRQRVMIAIALACDPKLLIADEPTTALDVTIQAQIFEVVRDLRKTLNMAIIWITHDLGVIASMADRVLVMYCGRIVEQASADELFAAPGHPYTRALLASAPAIRGQRARRLTTIPGQAPVLLEAPAGCPFAPRCGARIEPCRTRLPERQPLSPTHDAACILTQSGEIPTRNGHDGVFMSEHAREVYR